MKKIALLLISIMLLMTDSLVFATESKKSECKKFFQAASLNAALEHACGFNGGVSEKIAEVARAKCDSVMSEKELRKLHDDVFSDLRKDEKKYGSSAICENAKEGYLELTNCNEQFETWTLMLSGSSVCSFDLQMNNFITDYAGNMKSRCGTLFSQKKMDEITSKVLNNMREGYASTIKEMGEEMGKKLYCGVIEKQISDLRYKNN